MRRRISLWSTVTNWTLGPDRMHPEVLSETADVIARTFLITF